MFSAKLDLFASCKRDRNKTLPQARSIKLGPGLIFFCFQLQQYDRRRWNWIRIRVPLLVSSFVRASADLFR